MRLSEAAGLVGGRVAGDPDIEISGVAGLREAVPGELSFLFRPRYAPMLASTRASAVLVAAPVEGTGLPQIVVKDPEAAITVLAAAFAPKPLPFPPGIHGDATVAPGAVLGKGVSVGARAVIEEGARVGDRTVVRAGAFIGRGARLGADGHLHPGARLLDGVTLGDRVVVGSGAVVGCDGFGFLPGKPGEVPRRLPHAGTVVVGDDVDIGANVTIARARFGRTTIGNGVKIDTQVQVAHNCQVGDGALLISQVGLAGSTIVGRGAIMAGQSGAAGHLEIGDGARVAARGGVTHDVPAGEDVAGTPAIPHREWQKQTAALRKLPEILERLRKLEAGGGGKAKGRELRGGEKRGKGPRAKRS